MAKYTINYYNKITIKLKNLQLIKQFINIINSLKNISSYKKTLLNILKKV
jgi:hypothetical protein